VTYLLLLLSLFGTVVCLTTYPQGREHTFADGGEPLPCSGLVELDIKAL